MSGEGREGGREEREGREERRRGKGGRKGGEGREGGREEREGREEGREGGRRDSYSSAGVGSGTCALCGYTC